MTASSSADISLQAIAVTASRPASGLFDSNATGSRWSRKDWVAERYGVLGVMTSGQWQAP